MNASVFDVWVPKDGPSYIGSYGDSLKGLLDAPEDFRSVFGNSYFYKNCKIVLPDVIELKSRKNALIGENNYFHVRLALHYTMEIDTFDAEKHEKDFYQSSIGDKNNKLTSEITKLFTDLDKLKKSIYFDSIDDKGKQDIETDIQTIKYLLAHFKLDCNKDFIPIIHIIEGNHNREIFNTDLYEKSFPHAPRFRYIMDSGIWNYFAIDCIDFRRDLKEIISNWKSGYYNLSVAKEYADLNARLTSQSYLRVAPNSKSGHGADVVPFLFHSETKMKEIGKINELFKYKWRFLLLDDKIDINKNDGCLAISDSDKKITKRDILEKRISSILKDPGNKESKVICKTIVYEKEIDCIIDDETDILIVCVEKIEEALDLLKKYEFDIVLLDYLLGRINETDENSPHHYGYELLRNIHEICKDDEDKVGKLQSEGFQIGPQEKYFFMFISAFTTAVSERLNFEGFSRNEDIWEIGEGACPTNTPELFKYRLIHLMKRRLDQTGIKDLTEKKILETVKNIYNPMPNGSRDMRIKTVRQLAYKYYHKVLGCHYDYSVLQENDFGKSVLVKSFLEKQVHLGAMLEHLLQLVHLTAFGTIRQWPEIWEEYQFFARTINDRGNSDIRSLMNDITNSIESYIIDLKSE